MPRRIHRCCMLAIFAVVALSILPGIVREDVSGQEVAAGYLADRVGLLSLHVGEIETSGLTNLLVDQPESFDSNGHYIVQLDGPIDRARRAELESVGVELLDYMPYFAYIARLGGVTPSQLAAVSFLGWVGEFPNAWKLDARFGQREYQTPERQTMLAAGNVPVVVTLFRDLPVQTVYQAITETFGGTVHAVESVSGNVVVSATVALARIPELSQLADVQFVEEAPEITLRNTTNRWIVQSNISNNTPFYDAGIHGEGQIVGILDGRVSPNHCSFTDSQPFGNNHRKIQAYNTSTGTDTHGTHVAGTAVGDGGADNNNRGVAYLGKLCFDTTPSFTESGIRGRLITHHNQGSRIHTNSWGDDGTTSYNSLARGFDSFSHDFEDSMVCLAVTNTSTLRNPENAKNLLAVGASLDTPNQNSHCSGGVGPTADGRRKPEIYAPGCSTNSSNGNGCSTTQLTGTSMACPAVAGTGMLVRQYYVDGYYPSGSAVGIDGFTPSGALVKATLLNASVNMTGIGGYPSNLEGWGRVQAGDACFFTGDNRKLVVIDDVYNASGLLTSDTVEYTLEVLTSGEPLKVTMVFTDFPASASTGGGDASVNDLDLEVVSPGGQTYRGNVFSGGQSTTGGSADSGNNVEQVHRNNPQIGTWIVRVRGAAVAQGPQGYALLATGDVTPEQPTVRITLPNGAPETISSFQPTDFDVVIENGTETLDPTSPTLHYRYNGGAYQTAAMTQQAGTLWQASIPPGDCGDSPEFYLSAQSLQGSTATNPPSAPGLVYSAQVLDAAVFLDDNFQTDQGWTVENGAGVTAGAWERGTPTGGAGAPPSDGDGSGQCYVTGVANGVDLDGGFTRLFTPAMDLTGADAILTCDIWFTNANALDTFEIAVSPNGGFTWIPMETLTASTSGWEEVSYRINDFITPTGNVKVRFECLDGTSDNNVEGGVDGVSVLGFSCDDDSSITDCGPGATNVGCGAREDVLTINGSTGGAERTLLVNANTSMSFVLDEASAESGDGNAENACIYFWYAEPQPSDVVALPKNLGDMCFGPLLVASRAADVTFNSLGFNNKLGPHDAPASPPVVPDGGTLEFYSLPTGFGAPMSVTVQGLIPDACSQGNVSFSTTNGILIRVF